MQPLNFQGLLLMVGLFACPGCERVRGLAESVVRSKGSTGPASESSRVFVTNLSGNELGTFCHQRGTLTIVEYYANWNGESMQLIPVLNDITEEFSGRVLVGKINIDVSTEIVKAQGVKSVPDVRFYSDGVMVDRFVGLPENDEIRERIAAQVRKLPPPPSKGAKPASTSDAPKSEAKTAVKPVAEPVGKDWLPPGMRRR